MSKTFFYFYAKRATESQKRKQKKIKKTELCEKFVFINMQTNLKRGIENI